ncbi:hypothetical protein WK76_25100 [Burkholderia ubonensis]|nr:hypothetical protein WK76_25100 [Burkholderia ubonensis]
MKIGKRLAVTYFLPLSTPVSADGMAINEPFDWTPVVLLLALVGVLAVAVAWYWAFRCWKDLRRDRQDSRSDRFLP